MNYESKIYIGGHRGLVGSALMHNLHGKDFSRLIIRSRIELDLTNQAATEAFFAQIPEFVATNRVHEQTKTSSQRRRHYAESVPVVRRYAGGVPLKWRLIWPWSVWFKSRRNKQ